MGEMTNTRYEEDPDGVEVTARVEHVVIVDRRKVLVLDDQRCSPRGGSERPESTIAVDEQRVARPVGRLEQHFAALVDDRVFAGDHVVEVDTCDLAWLELAVWHV